MYPSSLSRDMQPLKKSANASKRVPSDFISKPVNPVVVRSRVHTHLTLKKQTDQLRLSANELACAQRLKRR